MSNYQFPPNQQTYPFSNTDLKLVNSYAINDPSQFGSNETSKQFGLPVPLNNVQAANSFIPGVTKGGAKHKHKRKDVNKTLKQKINNIVKKYKMGSKKSKMSLLKRLKKSVGLKGGKKTRKNRKLRK